MGRKQLWKKRDEEWSWRIVEEKEGRGAHLGILQQYQCITLPTQENTWLACVFCLLSPLECVIFRDMLYIVIIVMKQACFYRRCSGVLQKIIHNSLLRTCLLSWIDKKETEEKIFVLVLRAWPLLKNVDRSHKREIIPFTCSVSQGLGMK